MLMVFLGRHEIRDSSVTVAETTHGVLMGMCMLAFLYLYLYCVTVSTFTMDVCTSRRMWMRVTVYFEE